MSDSAPQWDQIAETICCPLCDYNLRGIVEPRCPECGYRFAWSELLDAARQSHPTLFDHNPRRTLRNFFATLRGGFSPTSFWTGIHPALACSRWRLLLYFLLYMTPCLVLLAGAVVALGMRYETMAVSWRAGLVTELSKPQNVQYANAEIARYGSLQAAARAYYPPWWSPRGGWRGLAWMMPVLGSAGCLMLAPAATLLGLMIFQASMRRARIKQVHVLRCVVYSYDVFFAVALAVLILAQLAGLFGAGDVNLPAVFSERGIFALRYRPLIQALGEYAFWTVLVVAGLRLGKAYQLYLRFDHPYWTIFCVQLIVTLGYAIVMVNGAM